MNIPKEFIQNIQGKDFVKYEGLLNMFHENGGKEIRTELVQSQLADEVFFIFKATVIGEKGIFEGHGDSCRANVNPMIVKHMMRMAETRAKARALRDYCNIGMTAAEELD
jgi:riboflavin biosynthesis pyrimidine reductase